MTMRVSGVLATMLEWLLVDFVDIVKLVLDGKRTAEQLQSLKYALRATIEGWIFQVVLVRPIKELCLSMDPAEVRQGWAQLYAKWRLVNWEQIPKVPYNTDRIRREKERGYILIFVLKGLATTKDLSALGRFFPTMGMSDDRIYWSDYPRAKQRMSGWMFVEKTFNAPCVNTTEEELRGAFSKRKTRGLTLNGYIIFGQFAKEVFGSYPDIDTWSRLMGYCNHKVCCARFKPDGSLDYDFNLLSDYADDHVGGRSVVT